MLRKKHYRQILLFAADLLIVILCFVVTCGIWQFDGHDISDFSASMPMGLFLFVCCEGVLLWLFKVYDSLWRYAEAREYLLLCVSVAFSFTIYLAVEYLVLDGAIPIFFSLQFCSLSLLIMVALRMAYRLVRTHRSKGKSSVRKINLAIVGAGSAGVTLYNEIIQSSDSSYLPVCFIDDSKEKTGGFIQGVSVAGTIDEIPRICVEKEIHEIIVAIPSMTASQKRRVVNLCSSTGCRVKILPDTVAMMETGYESLSRSLRKVQVEDLLGRDTVRFDDKETSAFIRDKVVLVTGGGGSIGSELCRQILRYDPKELVVVDIYENNVYDLQQGLKLEDPNLSKLKVEIASVRDQEKLDRIFDRYRPQIVFHAAAHKHVPLMEDCPEEAVKNNIFGTYNAVHAADRYSAEKFVLISTDKAVNPTNVMGATKRFCEMILQSMKGRSKTQFVAVRFGNVLGSNGSVIPLFQRQIENGGPVTITDKRIIRYFMTIPEAAQLVLQAGAMAKQSEVFVLDMGDPVKILDLAENLIRVMGYKPYEDIQIKEIGLRPGEKLYEELLMASEELEKTYNRKIFIEHQREILLEEIEEKLKLLQAALLTGCGEKVIAALHKTVPTFKRPEEVNPSEDQIQQEKTGPQHYIGYMPIVTCNFVQAK